MILIKTVFYDVTFGKMTLFKNQIFANLNGHAIIGVKIFFVTVGKIGAKTLQAWNPFRPPLLSVSEVKGFRGVCQTNKMSRKEGWNELDSEKVKIKRESGIWRYNDYSESFSVLITQSSRFRNKKTKTEGFRKKWRQKRENIWEWNFLTGKLLKNN